MLVCSSVYRLKIGRSGVTDIFSPVQKLSVEARAGAPPAAGWGRPPGRPRRNWLQQVEEDVGLSVGAAWIAGQDRSMWRTLRPSAGQAQQ